MQNTDTCTVLKERIYDQFNVRLTACKMHVALPMEVGARKIQALVMHELPQTKTVHQNLTFFSRTLSETSMSCGYMHAHTVAPFHISWLKFISKSRCFRDLLEREKIIISSTFGSLTIANVSLSCLDIVVWDLIKPIN